MKRILIISSTYTQIQYLKQIIALRPGEYRLCGTADNSVLGMTLIETAKPDLVIMPAFMSFWNAEDLVNYLLPRGICPTFILLNSVPCSIEPSAMVRVSEIIPSMMPSQEQLLTALTRAASYNPGPLPAMGAENNAVQHGLEVMELLMGLSPLDTREAQQRYGRLRVGKKSCWILLGASCLQPGENLYFAQIDLMEELFTAIPALLAPLGACEVCVYREHYLCILLAEGQQSEPDWGYWCSQVNELLKRNGIAPLFFEISDMPMPMEYWYSQCRELLQLRQKRFFLSPLYLQPKTLTAYKTFVSQAQLHAKLSALSQAIHGLQPTAVTEALNELEELLSHSLSMELYSYALTQMAVQYSNFRNSISASADDHALFYPDSFQSLQQVFQNYQSIVLSLMGQAGSFANCSNQIVLDVCAFINQHYAEPLTLEMAAMHVHINPTYLSRLFKKETAITFSAYINQVRIKRAMQLLEEGRKISDISDMVGYENPKYFSQVFKKVAGMTPQEYRNTTRKVANT